MYIIITSTDDRENVFGMVSREDGRRRRFVIIFSVYFFFYTIQ